MKYKIEAELIRKMIETREKKGISQRELAELSGMKQSAIARAEALKALPRIDTVIKYLVPLGYTLAIVPTDDEYDMQLLNEGLKVYKNNPKISTLEDIKKVL